jgi:predicted RNA-binding Zn-ribbon protein involved in translation (DUF1610 family)
MNYPLHKKNKEGNFLEATHSYYSDEYAQAMCDLYLSDELARNEAGRLQNYYRLHAKNIHSPEMELAYDIGCPKCGKHLKQVGRRISFNELGLYTCPACNTR